MFLLLYFQFIKNAKFHENVCSFSRVVKISLFTRKITCPFVMQMKLLFRSWMHLGLVYFENHKSYLEFLDRIHIFQIRRFYAKMSNKLGPEGIGFGFLVNLKHINLFWSKQNIFSILFCHITCENAQTGCSVCSKQFDFRRSRLLKKKSFFRQLY